MDALEQLRSAIPDAARDIRLNLQAVLRGGALTDAQRWGVAAAAAVAARHPRLREAVISRPRAPRPAPRWWRMPRPPPRSWR